MKKTVLKISVYASLLILTLNSCKKNEEQILPEAANTEVSDEVQDNFEITKDGHGVGLKLLPKEEYDKIPKISELEILNLPKVDKKFEENALQNKVNTTVKTVLMPSVGDQKAEGSCVGWTFGYEYASWIRSAFYTDVNPLSYSNTFSPEFIHNNNKTSSSCGSGCYMSNVLNFLKNTGVPKMSAFPMNYNSCSLKTTTATKTKVRNWGTVAITTASLKAWVDNGYPVAIAVTVDDNFYSQTYNFPYILKTRGGANYGGHAVTLIGYDDNRQAFKIQNHWGVYAQANGYFYISYNNVSNLINEAYIAW